MRERKRVASALRQGQKQLRRQPLRELSPNMQALSADAYFASFARTCFTSVSDTAGAVLVQAWRRKVASAAVSESLRRFAKPGITSTDGALAVDGVRSPARITCTSAVGFSALITVAWSSSGNTREAPLPVTKWQAAQLST